jgi:Glycosyl hydrolases family 43
VARSRDLVTWAPVGDVFGPRNRPAWAAPDAAFWAPDIRRLDGRYVLYYVVTQTTVTPEPNDNAIGVATAPTPAGPWTDSGGPVVGPRRGNSNNPGDFRWTFDPAQLTTPDGTRWLYSGSYYGGIFVTRLTSDGLRPAGAPTMVAIDNRYEGRLRRAPRPLVLPVRVGGQLLRRPHHRLPEMTAGEPAPFWHQGRAFAAELAATPWPGDPAAFARGTQRYQGLSDRLQAEVFRRHDHLGGWCVTELTDVPHELNGLLDLERRPKPAAVAELARASQPVLPMLQVTALTWTAGGRLRAPLHVANDGPELHHVEVRLRLGDATTTVAAGRLPGHRATPLGEVELPLPGTPGGHRLLLELTAGGRPLAANRYPVRVVARPEAPFAVQLLGDGATGRALDAVGARRAGTGPLVVAEGGLDQDAGARLRGWLAGGGTALVLAQAPAAAHRYPVTAAITPVGAAGWGSAVFHFTTDHDGLPSRPRRAVLTVEDLTVKPAGVLARLGAAGWPAETVVGAYKPAPDPVRGTVVGACPAGAGRLLACQFRLAEPAAGGDPAALALLADLVRLAVRAAAVPAAAPGATP